MVSLRSSLNADQQAGAGAVSVPQEIGPRSTTQTPPPEPPDGDAVVFDKSVSPLTKSLPPGSALLYVSDGPLRDGNRHFRLSFHFRGDCEESTPDEIRTQVGLNVSLAGIAERKRWKDDYLLLQTWWREHGRLQDWIDRLLATGGSEVRLLVWDTMTEKQIPWELYYVSDRDGEDLERHGWLGALIEVVRWTSVLQPGRRDVFTAEQTASQGTMLLLETADVTASGDGVAELVTSYGPPALPRIEDLLGELRRVDLRFALLLMHCHGVNAGNAADFEVAGLSLNELDSKPMPALSGSKAVVILNACNTAKSVPVSADSPIANRSFAEMFLRKGAATVIATLGDIGRDHTYTFVHDLIKARGDDRRVARFLRLHRQEYAERINQKSERGAPAVEDYKAFFYSFMYVCFGHPDTTLHLTPVALEGAR